MSRVDEARRRAAGRHIENPEFGDHAAVVSADDYVLEDYPGERTSARAERSPRVQRSISAPRFTGSTHLGSLDPDLNGKLVGSPDTPPIVVEQYRRLAASLHELQVDSGLKTMMVTSAMPREGKTLTVTNLALTLSASYRRRVLLIDADLRRPALHKMFRLPKTLGLSEALRSGSRPHLLELSPLLSILPAGELEGDPLSALTSDRLAALIEQCTAAFDWVLFDAPPVGVMPDGNVIARVVKAVVFVIAAGVTPLRVIERAIDEIGREQVVGTVLNRIEEQQMATAHQYQEYYTGSAAGGS
jgi:capsular exopolysaccharide synthesis family protein